MALLFANNARTTLAAPIGDSDVTFTVVDGTKFPSFGGGDYAYITFTDASESFHEVVKVTSRAGNVFSGVTRGVDGTLGVVWAAGSKVELRIPRIAASEMLGASTNLVALEASATASAASASASAAEAQGYATASNAVAMALALG